MTSNSYVVSSEFESRIARPVLRIIAAVASVALLCGAALGVAVLVGRL
jgi:hypothetical protein